MTRTFSDVITPALPNRLALQFLLAIFLGLSILFTCEMPPTEKNTFAFRKDGKCSGIHSWKAKKGINNNIWKAIRGKDQNSPQLKVVWRPWWVAQRPAAQNNSTRGLSYTSVAGKCQKNSVKVLGLLLLFLIKEIVRAFWLSVPSALLRWQQCSLPYNQQPKLSKFKRALTFSTWEIVSALTSPLPSKKGSRGILVGFLPPLELQAGLFSNSKGHFLPF